MSTQSSQRKKKEKNEKNEPIIFNVCTCVYSTSIKPRPMNNIKIKRTSHIKIPKNTIKNGS